MTTATENLNAEERRRYQRHLSLSEVGIEGQQRLKAARVVVVGAGGLGSPATLYLAASGIGTLGIVDCDRVELSNLQRQVLFTTADVGRPKALAARERLLALNPDIAVEAHATRLHAGNAREILGRYDIVIDGTDRLKTRYLVNDACVLLRKPLVTAAIHRFEGQAMTYIPGRGPCYRCLFSAADDAAVPSCAEAGVLGVLPGMLGALQATEAIKLALGAGEALAGRLLTYDALDLRFQEFRFERRADCAVCGDHPTITDLEETAVPAPSPFIRQLTVEQVRRLLEPAAAGGPGPTLIDVREPYEFESGHIDGAVNIPLGELALHLDELPRDGDTVFICQMGGRSFAACQMALQAGVASPINLQGGMAAWDFESG